jgi:hypothetical protein
LLSGERINRKKGKEKKNSFPAGKPAATRTFGAIMCYKKLI